MFRTQPHRGRRLRVRVRVIAFAVGWMAERSKAPVSGTGLFGGVGSNPTPIRFFNFSTQALLISSVLRLKFFTNPKPCDPHLKNECLFLSRAQKRKIEKYIAVKNFTKRADLKKSAETGSRTQVLAATTRSNSSYTISAGRRSLKRWTPARAALRCILARWTGARLHSRTQKCPYSSVGRACA